MSRETLYREGSSLDYPKLHLNAVPIGSIMEGGGMGMLVGHIDDDSCWCLAMLGDDAGKVTKWGYQGRVVSTPNQGYPIDMALHSYGIEAPNAAYAVHLNAGGKRIVFDIEATSHEDAEERAQTLVAAGFYTAHRLSS